MNKLEKELELILEGKKEVNAKDKYGDTLLHLAAYYGKTDTVKLLIEKGGDVNVHETPLDVAAKHDHSEIAKLLIIAGAELNAQDRQGETPLDCVVYESQEKTIDIFNCACAN